MQLFISSVYKRHEDIITITDERIIHQCFHVLRYKSGQLLQLQDIGIRYTLCITNISKKEMNTIIQSIAAQDSISKGSDLTLLIALPNRRDKAETITQKLTEIGIEHIVFWRAKRSILRELPTKKLQRLQTIALEASEQSFRRSLPTITYLDNLFESDILSSGQIVLFHQDGANPKNLSINNQKSVTALIGPEGGFSQEEIDQLSHIPNNTSINLGNTILRMETAAIIGSRLLKNNC